MKVFEALKKSTDVREYDLLYTPVEQKLISNSIAHYKLIVVVFILSFVLSGLFVSSFYIVSANASANMRFDRTAQLNAPNFSLGVLNRSLSGYNDFSLRAFRGHVVILNFWATWCPPCRHEIPEIIKFYNSYKSKGVIVVGINVNRHAGGVGSFAKRHDMAYPVVYATDSLIEEYGGINSIPQTFFISKSGKIMFHWVGEISKGALYGITNKLISIP